MGHLGKNGNVVGKKKRTSSVAKPILVKTLVFAHKATAGQTFIDLTNLTTPSEMSANGFVQASTNDILSAKLGQNRGALELRSSLRGGLDDFYDYVVVSGSGISILDPDGLEEGEIITGRFKSTSDLLPVASKRIIKTYSLIIGQTTVNLGQEFKVYDNPTENIGAVKLVLGSTEIYRNTGNSSVVQDKDYYEVDSGNGYGTQIVLNSALTQALDMSADFGNRAITDSTALGQIEYLAGSLKKIADDLSVLAGTAANDYFNANPSEVERRVFGDSVLTLISDMLTKATVQETTVNLNGAFTGGTLKVVRTGNVVTLSATGVTHPSLSAVVSAAGLLPAWAIPTNGRRNVFEATTAGAGSIAVIDANTDGSIAISYLNNTLGAVARTSGGSNLTHTYNI